MKKTLILIAFIGLLSSALSQNDTVIPGSDPCTWGPNFWCENTTNVERCGLTSSDCEKYGGIKNPEQPEID